MKIPLPDTDVYTRELKEKGAILPLPVIKPAEGGFLSVLPPATDGKEGWPWNTETATKLYNTSITWPKLTIVTPSYNQAEFLEQTIRSVLLQNYPNLEYIVIDGGSTDASLAIIKKYEPWLSYWQSEKDSGQANAINQGFSIASGDFYAWLNSDDYYLADTFFKVIKAFQSTRAKFVYGYAQNYLSETNVFSAPTKVLPLVDYLLRFPSLAQPSCFWDSSIHQPLWEELHCSLDYELWLRIVKGNKRHLIRQPLSVANIHGDAKTSDPKMKERWHHDHLLICGQDAHGIVTQWNTRFFLNRVYHKFFKWLNIY